MNQDSQQNPVAKNLHIKNLTKREKASVAPKANANSLPSNQNADTLFWATKNRNNTTIATEITLGGNGWTLYIKLLIGWRYYSI